MVDHKESGNAAFKAGNWTKAIEHYSAGLALDSDSEASATLYSNRSASWNHDGNYDRAILDANSVIRTRPEWSKGSSRLAEALTAAHEWRDATLAYNDAILLAENPSTKSRYETARNSIRSLGSNRLGFSNVLQTYEPQARSRCQKLHDQGKLDFTSHPTNSAQNYVLAHDLVLKGYKDLANSVLPEAGGSFIDANDIIGSLSDGILRDHRAFFYSTDQRTLFALNELMSSLSNTYEYNAFLDPENDFGTAPELINYFAGKLKDPSFKVKEKIHSLIRMMIVKAHLLDMDDKGDAACAVWMWIVEFVESGMDKWEDLEDDVIEATVGMEFNSEFYRAVLNRLRCCIEVGLTEFERYGREDDELFSAEALRDVADSIVESCENYPCAPEDASYIAFHAIPFAQAQFSLGYLSVRLAVEQASKHGKGVYYHRESCQTASSHFVQSAEIMPKDCTEYAIVLFYALALDLRAGDLEAGVVFDRAAEAERAYTASDAWYGPQTHSYECRNLVRSVCGGLRTWLEGPNHKTPGLEDYLTTLQGVPTIRFSEVTPGDPMNGLDIEYMKSQPEQIGLGDYLS